MPQPEMKIPGCSFSSQAISCGGRQPSRIAHIILGEIIHIESKNKKLKLKPSQRMRFNVCVQMLAG